jgi:hypothetical protein
MLRLRQIPRDIGVISFITESQPSDSAGCCDRIKERKRLRGAIRHARQSELRSDVN